MANDKKELVKELESMFHSQIIGSAYCEAGVEDWKKANCDIADFIIADRANLRADHLKVLEKILYDIADCSNIDEVTMVITASIEQMGKE
jgi:DNA-binding SARP family transcriptional activator